jgi:hypothetical protein
MRGGSNLNEKVGQNSLTINNRHTSDGKIMWGMYKGVRVWVIKTHGKISTVFPDSIQPIRRK